MIEKVYRSGKMRELSACDPFLLGFAMSFCCSQSFSDRGRQDAVCCVKSVVLDITIAVDAMVHLFLEPFHDVELWKHQV